MPVKNSDRRLALRFSLYIHALGSVPLPYQGQSLKAYTVDLQQQYERLRQELGPDKARAARIAGRTAIRERGFAHAATLFPISVPPIAKKSRQSSQRARTQSANSPVQISCSAPKAAARRDLYNCRRKLRHGNFLSALLHARRLQDEDIHIYPCPLCDGLHVGHAPSTIVRRQRRITKELERVQRKLQDINRDQELLLKRERELRSGLREILEVQGPAALLSSQPKYVMETNPREAS